MTRTAGVTEAAVLVELGRPLELMELEIPALEAGQLLVEVAYSGVCRSQLLEARGLRGPDRFLPHALGHEGSGTVLEVGPGVRKVRAGDRVVLSWIKGSGADVPSTAYRSSEGRINSGAIATFMRATVTCENRVTPLPEDMPFRAAALLGCAFPTGAGIVFNQAELAAGASVAVFGAGGIGLAAIMAARAAGAAQVVAVDIHDHKLEQALKLGASHTVHAGRENALERISEITAGAGVELAVEAAGRVETMENAFRSVRLGGGLAVIAGNLAHGEQMSLDPMDLIRGRRIIGSWGGATSPDRDFPRYAELHRSGRLDLDGLITHSYSLAGVNEALAALERGELGRALIDMSEDWTGD